MFQLSVEERRRIDRLARELMIVLGIDPDEYVELHRQVLSMLEQYTERLKKYAWSLAVQSFKEQQAQVRAARWDLDD